METSDILKQLEINYDVLLNDLEFASHELGARMEDAARYDQRVRESQSAAQLSGNACSVTRCSCQVEQSIVKYLHAWSYYCRSISRATATFHGSPPTAVYWTLQSQAGFVVCIYAAVFSRGPMTLSC